MQNLGEHQLNDLDHFLMKNNQQPTPKRTYANNHGGKIPQPLPLHRNHHQHKENQPLINNQSRSPARCYSKSNLSSHDNSQSSLNLSRRRAKSRRSKPIMKHCQNHEDIEGSYKINIEGQDLFYCQKCAMKLRSQGFPIKMEANARKGSHNRIETSGESSITSSYPHLQDHPQFQTLKMLLSTIYSTEEQIRRKTSAAPSIDKTFEKISQNFEEKMDELEQIIRIERSKGRKLLKKVLYDTQKDSMEEKIMEESLSDIHVMKVDIEDNIESIVGQIDSSTFEQCVQSYKEKIQNLHVVSKDYLNFIEESRMKFEDLCQQSFKNIQNDIDNSIKIERIQFEESSISCHEEMPERKAEPKGPFRNLFNAPRQNKKRNLSAKE